MKHQTTRKLDVPLTEDELAVKAQELASTLAKYDATEEEKKARSKDLGDHMKKLRADCTVLRREVATKTTKKLVDCYQEPNVKRRVWEVRRQDTGAIVETIAMTPPELEEARQMDLERDLLADKREDTRA